MLKEHIASGNLFEFHPALRRGQTNRRGMYMTPQISRWLGERPREKKKIEHHQFIMEALARFVRGNKIDNRFYMERLERGKAEVWEIRIQPAPKVRIFAAFIYKDCFICTNKRPRDELKKRDSSQWKSAKRRAVDRWAALFPGREPLTASHFSDYVTNGEHFDWRS